MVIFDKINLKDNLKYFTTAFCECSPVQLAPATVAVGSAWGWPPRAETYPLPLVVSAFVHITSDTLAFVFVRHRRK